ncbi:hypothetical protein AVEN_184617-1 [Araneus ventricosus]|uniref:Uncharacterized protein n=1 Tax=Araneus ventricosus TaxID=182803 RepID=A0A4Y2EBG7_ARAVE|nr:hypothetical protein AVEN_184617-1 [Araneus ventricosus]
MHFPFLGWDAFSKKKLKETTFASPSRTEPIVGKQEDRKKIRRRKSNAYINAFLIQAYRGHSHEKVFFSPESAGGCGYDVTIRNCFRHGGFIRTKRQDNPDVIQKPVNLTVEHMRPEKTTEETTCQAKMRWWHSA